MVEVQHAWHAMLVQLCLPCLKLMTRSTIADHVVLLSYLWEPDAVHMYLWLAVQQAVSGVTNTRVSPALHVTETLAYQVQWPWRSK